MGEEPGIEDQALWDCHSHSTFSRKHSWTTPPDTLYPAEPHQTVVLIALPFSQLPGPKTLESIFSSFPCLHIELITGSFPFLLSNVFEAILTLVNLVWVYILTGLQTSGSGPSNPLYIQMSKRIFFAFSCHPCLPYY